MTTRRDPGQPDAPPIVLHVVSHSDGPVGHECGDVRSELDCLAALVSTSVASMDTLRQIASIAVAVVPPADGAVLSLADDRSGRRTLASGSFVRAADDLQYTLAEGPAIAALEDGMSVGSGSLGGEPRWPRFGPRVGRMGIHSVLAVPVRVGRDVVGTITLYSQTKAAFGPAATRVAESYAALAAAMAWNAHVIESSRERIADLTEALHTRPVIDRAVGIIISRSGITPEVALERLRRRSNRERVTVSVIAQQIVDDAVRRANGQRRSAVPRIS